MNINAELLPHTSILFCMYNFNKDVECKTDAPIVSLTSFVFPVPVYIVSNFVQLCQ